MRCRAGSSSTTRTLIWRSASSSGRRSFNNVSRMRSNSAGLMIAGVLLALVWFQSDFRTAAKTLTPKGHQGQEPITPIVDAPAAHPLRVALGERLFHDPRLSRDNTRSCSSCHDIGTNGASLNAHDAAASGEP